MPAVHFRKRIRSSSSCYHSQCSISQLSWIFIIYLIEWFDSLCDWIKVNKNSEFQERIRSSRPSCCHGRRSISQLSQMYFSAVQQWSAVQLCTVLLCCSAVVLCCAGVLFLNFLKCISLLCCCASVLCCCVVYCGKRIGHHGRLLQSSGTGSRQCWTAGKPVKAVNFYPN